MMTRGYWLEQAIVTDPSSHSPQSIEVVALLLLSKSYLPIDRSCHNDAGKVL